VAEAHGASARARARSCNRRLATGAGDQTRTSDPFEARPEFARMRGPGIDYTESPGLH